MYILKVRYKHEKSWNCDKIFDSPDEFMEWVNHEIKCGNKLVIESHNTATVYINF